MLKVLIGKDCFNSFIDGDKRGGALLCDSNGEHLQALGLFKTEMLRYLMKLIMFAGLQSVLNKLS